MTGCEDDLACLIQELNLVQKALPDCENQHCCPQAKNVNEAPDYSSTTVQYCEALVH